MSQGTNRGRVALVLTGGGARAAYQVGLLRSLGRHYPDLHFDIVTGVSAGAINAAYLAAHPGNMAESADALTDVWMSLTPERVFRVDTWSLFGRSLRWGLRLISGGSDLAPKPSSLIDVSPLRELLGEALDADEDDRLPGIQHNIDEGRLKSVALTTLDWGTGQTVTWVQGDQIQTWERPGRTSRSSRLTVDHVMASASLPMIFPAVEIEGSWHGDGGVRLAFPLAPALHLGADRMIAISTRHRGPGARSPDTDGYPPPAQIAGLLLNAVFLDQLDADALQLQRLNLLLPRVDEEERGELRPVELCVVRPSEDLGALSARFELKLPPAFRFLTRGLGTRQTRSPDLLSLLLFQPDYVGALIEIGERDAEANREQLIEVLGPSETQT